MRSVTTCIGICLLMLSVSAQVKKGSPPSLPDDLLNRQVGASYQRYLPTSDAFSLTLNLARVTGGMARVHDCDLEEPKQMWGPMQSPLRDALDAIVYEDPRYRWHLEDGVVNLLPASGEPAFLKIRIPRFRVKHARWAKEALQKLLALDEVKKAMQEHNLKQGLTIIISPHQPNPKGFSVDCRDVTLREALNAIARAEGWSTWSYIETHCEDRHEFIIRF